MGTYSQAEKEPKSVWYSDQSAGFDRFRSAVSGKSSVFWNASPGNLFSQSDFRHDFFIRHGLFHHSPAQGRITAVSPLISFDLVFSILSCIIKFGKYPIEVNKESASEQESIDMHSCERESGENPERSGHCKQKAAFHIHCSPMCEMGKEAFDL